MCYYSVLAEDYIEAQKGMRCELTELAHSLGLTHAGVLVCVPHGTTLRISGIPKTIQKICGVRYCARATFIEDRGRNQDRVRFENGTEALLNAFTPSYSRVLIQATIQAADELTETAPHPPALRLMPELPLVLTR